MKILLVSNGFPPSAFGGVEVYSYDLARELTRRGHEVRVFCRESDPQRPDYEILKGEVEGIPVIRVVNDFKRVHNFAQLYTDETIDRIFADLLDTFQPDLVHFNHLLALSAALPFETRKRQIPSITTLHDYWVICHRVNLVNSEKAICPGPQRGANCYRCLLNSAKGPRNLIGLVKRVLPYPVRVKLRQILHRAPEAKIILPAAPADFAKREQTFRQALSGVDRLVVPSQFVRGMLAENGYPAEQIQVIPLGIGSTDFAERETLPGVIRFGFVGSVLPLKGLENLIRAFRVVKEQNICLDIYGREDVQPFFSRHIHDLTKGDSRITFHGSFAPDQRGKVYARIDLLVIPSLSHETFSLVAREALQSGIPVIAARVGALPEVIREGVNGYLYNAGDEQALASLIRKIAQEPEQLHALHAPGPIEIISVSEHVDRIEQVYTAVVNA